MSGWNFLFRVFNFALLAGFFVWLFRRFNVLDRFLGGYQSRVRARLEEAARLEREAEALKRRMEEELRAADARARQILEQARLAARREREERLAQAQAQADAILEQARLAARREREDALKALHREAVDEALRRAAEWIRAEITPQDHARLVRAFLEDLTEEHLKDIVR